MPTDLIDSVRAQLHARLLALRAETAQIEGALSALSSKPLTHRGTQIPAAAFPEAVAELRKDAKRRTTKRRQPKRRGPRPAKTTRAYLIDALVGAEPAGLTIADLATRLQAAGWQTAGAPKNVLSAELHGTRGKDYYQHDGAGHWTLRAPVAPPEPVPAKRRKSA